MHGTMNLITRSSNVTNLQLYTNISCYKPDDGLLKEAEACSLETKRHITIKAK
jgi:hypothetical protein